MGQLTNPSSTIQVSKLQEFYNTLLTLFYQKPNTGIPATDLAEAVQTAITAAGTALQPDDLDTLNGKVAALEALISEDPDATTHAIDKFNEIVAFLAGISDTQTLDGIISGISDQIAAKYTKPGTGIPASDLAQGVQDILNAVAGKADKSEMSVVPGTGADVDKTTITLKSGTSATVLTTHQDISGKVDKEAGKGLSTNDYSAADKAKVDGIVYATSEDIAEIFS